jgi:Fic/DOC family
VDAVIAAAVPAFGFVYAHPFVDGNGRIHRYLIHHVLAQRGFNPAGVVFPVSAAILARIDEYRATLEDYSRRLSPVIDWEPTADSNVNVLNDTADFYRFFDATPHAEFLYACVKNMLASRRRSKRTCRARLSFWSGTTSFAPAWEAIVDMPDRTIDLLFRFLHQNAGRLSKRARVCADDRSGGFCRRSGLSGIVSCSTIGIRHAPPKPRRPPGHRPRQRLGPE